MKKIGYVLLGLAVTTLLYMAFLYLTTLTFGSALGDQYWWLFFAISLPVCLTIGSCFSGYLFQPHMKQRSFFRYLLISPGFYLSLVGIVPLVVYLAQSMVQPIDTLPENYPSAVIFLLPAVLYLEWIVASFIGTRIGVLIRDRKTRESNKRLHRIANKHSNR